MNLGAWECIEAPALIIDWLQFGVPISLDQDIEGFHLPNRLFSPAQCSFLDKEISRLCLVDAIEPCFYQPKCVSPINVVPKRNNKLRLVIDLRQLNQSCNPPRFANEDVRTVKNLLCFNDDLAVVDLKDGFLHVPVRREYRDLLGFMWNGQYYRFKKLPFGLALSPYYFCKILRPVVTYLRSLGLRIVLFVDDLILMSQPDCFTDHLDQILHTLCDLGWTINYEKSSLTPRKEVTYLGYKVRSCGRSGFPEISVMGERIRKLRRSIHQALTDHSFTARCLASITGQCVAMSQVIMPAKLLLRSSYRLLRQRQHWESPLTLDPDVRRELQWWIDYVTDWNVYPVQVRPIELQLVTDASHLAWGATLGERHASGQWTHRMSRQSSNYRELMAVFMGLQTFEEMIKDKSVQVLTDNITALAYIVNKGGPSQELTEISIAVWHLCHQLNVHLQVAHIKGLENQVADRLSRVMDNYNWQLHPGLFGLIDRLFGPHTVDRFASVVNTQLPRFNSRFWEPHTEGIDALAQQNWGQEINFVNPPFRLIPQVLSVIWAQHAEAMIIAP